MGGQLPDVIKPNLGRLENEEIIMSCHIVGRRGFLSCLGEDDTKLSEIEKRRLQKQLWHETRSVDIQHFQLCKEKPSRTFVPSIGQMGTTVIAKKARRVGYHLLPTLTA